MTCTWTATEPSSIRTRCDNCKGKSSRRCYVNRTLRIEITKPHILARFIGTAASTSTQQGSNGMKDQDEDYDELPSSE
jgi:hypothetical protein